MKTAREEENNNLLLPPYVCEYYYILRTFSARRSEFFTHGSEAFRLSDEHGCYSELYQLGRIIAHNTTTMQNGGSMGDAFAKFTFL